MFTVLLRNNVVHLRHSAGGGKASRVACTICTSTRRETQLPHLTPNDVNLILRENEFVYTFPGKNSSTIESYESNQLGSNQPCEDTRTEASFLHRNGFICGVFDGHAGPACSQVTSKRLLRYIAASIIDREALKEQIIKGCTSQSFLNCHNDKVDFVREIKTIYEDSFTKYLETISNRTPGARAAEIESAFIQLDNDLSEEALSNHNMRTMAVAMSGAVACVAHIENLDLHVASTGDCSAVLGVQCPDTGNWHPKKLNNEHNTDNLREVERILGEHPREEHDTAIRNERLLGQLAPLRALGDFRYKWSLNVLKKHVVPSFGENSVPPHYYTPPYLTARPEVHHHILGANDKFLVIGSDGLWDFLSPSQVVSLVGEHINSKRILKPMVLPPGDVTLDDIAKMLAKRKAGLARKPLDQNSATHLIRNALGSTDYGIEHSKLAYYLSLPQDVVRLYRDDITVTVVFFDSGNIEKLTKAS